MSTLRRTEKFPPRWSSLGRSKAPEVSSVEEIISEVAAQQLAFEPLVNLQCKSPVLFLGADIHMSQDGNFPRHLLLSIALIFSFLAVPAAFAQSAASGSDNNKPEAANSQKKTQPEVDPLSRPLSEKQRRANEKALHRELQETYKKWLEQDVRYIIGDEERSAFMKLSNDEERDQFIEQFWLRRDPTPDTEENEYKEEHYRRIAYANEHFAAGIPGWRTDRGRMYIMYGPADEVESHPSGGFYQRPIEEGGGQTSTFPFEQWRYRHIEGIGQEVIIAFVDTCMSGEYHMTMDPSEKDALLHVPGAGLSLMESMGMASKADRFTRSDGTNLPTTMGGQPASMNEFNRLELYAKVNKPPEVKFKDLEAVVTSRIVRDQVHFNWRTDYLKVTNDTVLVPVTIQIPNSQLSFQSKDGIHSATMNIFMRVSTLTGRVVQTQEDPVSKDFPDSLFQQSFKLQSIY